MTPERWDRLAEALDVALELQGAQRREYVDQVKGEDAALGVELERLIENHEESGAFLESDAALPHDPMSGRRAGPYLLIRETGRGGMATVYLAERADGEYSSRVAIKIVHQHLGAENILRRFRNERQVLAALNHPGIAKLLDGGAIGDGIPYLVMEYVDGVHLDEWRREHDPPLVNRLQLIRDICSAVQYAHEHQVIHRDIKPGNILVTAGDSPKLLDFGIAKVLNPDASSVTDSLTTGALMTPQYASPEQVRGEPITPATDVYALGVVMYELLTDQLPYVMSSRDPAQVVRAICELEPDPPSEAAADMATRKLLEGDLDNIILKALRKDPARRYQSAAELSEDIERHLTDKPVRARPDTFLYRSRKFFKRNRMLIASAAAGAAAVLALITSLSHFRPQTAKSGATVESVAVLPFENTSGHPEDEAMADAFTEDLIGDLGRIKSLRVIASNSAMHYKRTGKTSHDIARELGANVLVNGLLYRSGDKLRVTVQLKMGELDRIQFAKIYERDLREVSALRQDAAKAIAGAIRIKLTPEEYKRLSLWGPVNKDAYEKCLKGRYYLNKHTVTDYQRALQQFQEAVEADPAFAVAWVGLAETYWWMSELYLAPNEAMPKAKAAVRRALDIDDTLAEAHSTLGVIQGQYERDWTASERSLKRAIELSPSYVQAHLMYSYHLAARGRVDEAIHQAEEAVRFDPLPALLQANLAWMYVFAKRPDAAIALCRKTLASDPNSAVTHASLALAYLQKGLYEQAIVEFRKAAAQQTTPLGGIGFAYAVSGRVKEARQTLAELAAASKREYVSAYYFATVHVGLKEVDKAFEYLEKAYNDRSEEMVWMNVDPYMGSIRGDPRFKDLSRRMGL